MVRSVSFIGLMKLKMYDITDAIKDELYVVNRIAKLYQDDIPHIKNIDRLKWLTVYDKKRTTSARYKGIKLSELDYEFMITIIKKHITKNKLYIKRTMISEEISLIEVSSEEEKEEDAIGIIYEEKEVVVI